MIRAQMRSLIERLVAQGQSHHKLALTCALGVFIGISPLIGLHTVMTCVFAWFFSLNIAALFAVSVFINNPWTMVPVYSIDHLFGAWFLRLLDIHYLHFDPVWLQSCNLFLKERIGIEGVSLIAFLVGGNLLAFGMSIIVYPMARRICASYLSSTVQIVKQ